MVYIKRVVLDIGPLMTMEAPFIFCQVDGSPDGTCRGHKRVKNISLCKKKKKKTPYNS